MAGQVNALGYLVLLGMAVAGLWTQCRSARAGPAAAAGAVVLLALLSLPVSYYLAPRQFNLHYRFPIEVLLIACAAGPVARLLARTAVIAPLRARLSA